MKLNLSTKRLQIDKANTTVVIVISIAAALTTFSLVGAKTLLDQRSFQSRVISKKSAALDQIEQNVKASETLANSYAAFVTTEENIIGGSSTGEGGRDGDNARIILDALPSKYDFPAVTTSVEKILTDLNLIIVDISGIDDEIAQRGQEAQVNPEPIEIPFTVAVEGSYEAMQNLITSLQVSIRPIQITELSIRSDGGAVNVDLNAKTFYQPEKSIDIRTEVIR